MSDARADSNQEIVQPESEDLRRSDEAFPIVGVGASAGGLGAFESFFANLPAEPGMAFVLVQHLDPHHESELAELLQNHTEMPVTQAVDGQAIEVNSVYVIPPGQSLSIENGVLYLAEPDKPRGQRALIDRFFRSLAEDQGENAICIILSGTGTDGTLGLKRIKERGGVVLVQSPEDLEEEQLREQVRELDELNDRALTVARSLTVELRPPVLQGEGLVQAFGWLAGHMQDVYGLRVEVSGDEQVEPLTDDLRELAFQLVRELLFNVVKHAGVDRARLHLEQEGGRCHITVADEGKGFDAAFLEEADISTAGYGLRSIRERLELFGGTLSLAAAPGAGTEVTLTVPCDNTTTTPPTDE